MNIESIVYSYRITDKQFLIVRIELFDYGKNIPVVVNSHAIVIWIWDYHVIYFLIFLSFFTYSVFVIISSVFVIISWNNGIVLNPWNYRQRSKVIW